MRFVHRFSVDVKECGDKGGKEGSREGGKKGRREGRKEGRREGGMEEWTLHGKEDK